MLRLEWNALRPGDHVVVHDDADVSSQLSEGVVTLAQTDAASNDAAVRVRRVGTQSVVVRPRELAVHLLPFDPGEPCSRCGTLAERSHPEAKSTGVRAP